jgi:hypothetical protein
MTVFAAAFVVYLVYLLRRPMSWLLIAGFHVSSTRSSPSVGLSAARPWLRSRRLSPGDTDAGGLYSRIWAAQLALLPRERAVALSRNNACSAIDAACGGQRAWTSSAGDVGAAVTPNTEARAAQLPFHTSTLNVLL